ncbi:MAG: hypothetical protein ACI4CT_04870 [Lachnospiraceae bacterium]
MKKYVYRVIAGLVALLLLCSSLTAFVSAKEKNSPKEEVVYVNLDGQGSVKEINVVNSFVTPGNGVITDYGDYETLRNMTSNDRIQYQNGKVSISTGDKTLYYEGKLKQKEMPWTVAIHYYIDGKEYVAGDVAGKSGQLEIAIQIKENKKCSSSFFEDYALQINLLLDTEQCRNIEAGSATVANVGSRKQLTYTVFPGKGADISVKADVEDFEMDGITLNGVKLNLDFDSLGVPSEKKMKKAIHSIEELDDGAGEIQNGVQDLYSAVGTLKDKTSQLYTGTGQLVNGSKELSAGLSALSGQNQALLQGAKTTYKALCKQAETAVNSQLAQFGMPEIQLTPENYTEVLNQLQQQVPSESLAELQAQLDSYGTFYEGLVSYTSAVAQSAGGANKLQQNMNTWYENVGRLSSATGALQNGVQDLSEGTQELKNGTEKFTRQTDTFDSMIDIVSEKNEDAKSFVSEKNTNIKSVQFVIETESIEIPEVEKIVVEEEKTTSFWKKLLQLFGL